MPTSRLTCTMLAAGLLSPLAWARLIAAREYLGLETP